MNDPAASLRDLSMQLRGEASKGPQIEHVLILPTIDAALDLVQTAIPKIDSLSLARFAFRLGTIVDRATSEYCRRRLPTHEQLQKGRSQC